MNFGRSSRSSPCNDHGTGRPDGSAVALSIGKYFTPKGVSLAEVGITPDVVVTVNEEQAAGIYYGTLTPEEDPQIQAARHSSSASSLA